LIPLLLVAAYVVGSIPFGYLIARANGVDILKAGSGNIGATNVYRVLGSTRQGKWLGLGVFLLDVLKGFLPAATGYYLLGHSQLWAFLIGMGAVAGHCLSPFLGFKGGKGVATGLGVVFGSCPLVAASAFGIFLISMALTRFVSLSSLIAAIALVPLGFAFQVHYVLIWAFAALALFVFYRHRPNIKRLLSGDEPKFVFKSDNT